MDTAAAPQDRHPAERAFLGRDPQRSVRLLAVAGALFVATFVVHVPPQYVGPLSVPVGLSLPVLVGTAVVVAAAGAYLNDGLLVCIALAGGVSYGFYFPLVLFELAYPSETVLWALGVGGGFAVVLGGVGFAVGAAGRRVLARVTA
jgi:hypothetical protein